MEDGKILEKYLQEYLCAAESIKQLIKSKGFRFSYKKFVADLGEYYFFQVCQSLFKTDSLKQSIRATASYDYEGIFHDKELYKIFGDESMRIEVKTRYAQVYNPNLLGIKCDKFDVLAFVYLREDYSWQYISLLRVEDIRPIVEATKKNRLVYKKDLPIIWQTGEFVRLKPSKKTNES